MLRNMGTTDRSIRVLVGVVAVLVSAFFGWGSLAGTIVGTVLLVVAGIMFVTAAVGFCPTYRLLNISTYPTLHKTSGSKAKVPVPH